MILTSPIILFTIFILIFILISFISGQDRSHSYTDATHGSVTKVTFNKLEAFYKLSSLIIQTNGIVKLIRRSKTESVDGAILR